MTTGPPRRRRSGSGGGPVAEAPGYTARTPDSLPRGPVSTALTSTSQPPKHPAEIVGILRFFLGVRRRCTCDVSTMDTNDLPDLFPPRIAAFRTTSLPRLPARTSVSEVMTLTCLRSEETAQSRTATWTIRVARVGVMQADLVQILRMSRSVVWGAWCFSGRGIILPQSRHVDASSS